MRHAFEIDATPHEVWLGRESGEYILHLDNERLPVSLNLDDQGHGSLRIDGETVPITLARRGDDCFIHLDGSTWQLRYRDPLERASALAHGSHDDDIRAPMPGTTISVRVAPGDAVLKGAVPRPDAARALHRVLRRRELARASAPQRAHHGGGCRFARAAPGFLRRCR